MKNVKIVFNALTPLWTGDAWGENNVIRPSSLMGSLRFWFEVICFFPGITDKNDYEKGKLKDNVDGKVLEQKILKNGADFSSIDKTLAEMGITLPSKIFGCTGWKGWIRIKEVRTIEKKGFRNKLNLPYAITVSKDNKFNLMEYFEKEKLNEYISLNYSYLEDWKKKNKKFRKEHSVWYFAQPYFYGKFELIFEVEEKILEQLFYPLLTFMEKYGFWGGKWNIGYGRLKVEKVEIKNNNDFEEINSWRKEEFGFSEFFKDKYNKFENKKFSDFIYRNNSLNNNSNSFDFLKYFLEVDSFYCKTERNFPEKISNIPLKFKTIVNLIKDNDYNKIIKELIKIKSQIRDCLRPGNSLQNKKEWNDFRHKLLGTTSGDTEGTKIIPWIYEENGQLKGGFVSIAGILN